MRGRGGASEATAASLFGAGRDVDGGADIADAVAVGPVASAVTPAAAIGAVFGLAREALTWIQATEAIPEAASMADTTITTPSARCPLFSCRSFGDAVIAAAGASVAVDMVPSTPAVSSPPVSLSLAKAPSAEEARERLDGNSRAACRPAIPIASSRPPFEAKGASARASSALVENRPSHDFARQRATTA